MWKFKVDEKERTFGNLMVIYMKFCYFLFIYNGASQFESPSFSRVKIFSGIEPPFHKEAPLPS